MRRLFRLLLSAATALSLLLLVLTVGLWVRSYWTADIVSWEDGNVNKSVSTVRGGIFLAAEEMLFEPEAKEPKLKYERQPAGPVQAYEDLGTFGFSRNHSGGGYLGIPVADVVRVPLYPLVTTLAILPSIGWVRRNRARRATLRRRRGFCPACGYDLRATPERCPECGAIPNAKDARLPGPGG